MNTAIVSGPYRRVLNLDRIRGLYNGFGYIFVLCQIQNLWWTTQATLPLLVAGHAAAFGRGFLFIGWWTFAAMIPGPTLIPPVVNLAPRAGLGRLLCLLGLTLPMSWWCLAVIDQVHFSWNWSSLGFALDGLLTTGIVVGVCAYHSATREAEDALLSERIRRTRLDSDLMQAQLQLLRAQIEPHFLFNTLSVVRALARSDRTATVTMLDNLIRYFEAALPRMRESEVTLTQELELVEAYLSIYRTRMGSRLVYELDAPEELGGIRIPSMMLLTLVENALKHGVSPTVEGGLIRVSAAFEKDRLLLQVADSGRGLDVRQGHGTGLANIRQRLLMMYGNDALLTLRRAEPRGMVASIHLPAL
ncbi:MAG TPA: histidine kinase [Steroidobacteraceae bacterium]|nr:histidine kinase [Steroidobacteraceae bacterium]